MLPAREGSHAQEFGGTAATAAYDAPVRGEAWLKS